MAMAMLKFPLDKPNQQEEIPMEEFQCQRRRQEEEDEIIEEGGVDGSVNGSGCGSVGGNEYRSDTDTDTDSVPPPPPPPQRAAPRDEGPYFGRAEGWLTIPRPAWLWIIGAIDIIWILVIAWSSYQKMKEKLSFNFEYLLETSVESKDELKITPVLVNCSYATQVILTLVIILIVCTPHDRFFIFCMCTYMCGSYFMIGNNTFIIISSLLINLASTDEFGHDKRQKILTNVVNTFVKATEAVLVHDYLRKHRRRQQRINNNNNNNDNGNADAPVNPNE